MDKMKCWTRYVDDTLCYIKTDSIDYVLKMLNGFHRNIQFTYEVEIDSKISFLDVLVIRDSSNNINTAVYRKSTNNDIYLNWESFAPDKWKWGTLKTLTKRAYDVCCNQELLQKELNYIEKVFRVNNNYPNWVIKKVLQQAKQQQQQQQQQQQHQPQQITADTAGKNYFLLLPYKGEKGEHLIKSMKRRISKLLPPEFKTQVTCTGKKLGTSFNVKDQSKFDHQHDVVYYVDCPNETCRENYIGESGRRISERIKDHNGRDLKSHILRHSVESGHANVSCKYFKIIAKNFSNNSWKRKIAESLLIQEKRPTLNIHDKSVPLKLFN